MPKFKTILLIGSTGYIGSNFLNYIIKKNFKITTIAIKNDLKNRYNNINHIKCDITNLNLLKKKLNKKKSKLMYRKVLKFVLIRLICLNSTDNSKY